MTSHISNTKFYVSTTVEDKVEGLLDRGLVPALLPPTHVMTDMTGLLRLGPAPTDLKWFGGLKRSFVPVMQTQHLSDKPKSYVLLSKLTYSMQLAHGSWMDRADLWVDGERHDSGVVWTLPWAHLTFWKHLKPYVSTSSRRTPRDTDQESLPLGHVAQVMRRQRDIIKEARDLPLRDKVLEVSEACLLLGPSTLVGEGSKSWLALADKTMLRIP